MTIRLTGILPNPFGDPCPKALIRFTAIATEGGMLKGTDAVATTDKFGSYDFPLEQGRYLLEIQYSDEYLESGSVLVDDASPETMTLQELIRYTTPYTPPLVDDTPADWVSLFEGVLANPDWQHEHENQVRNEDVLVNTDKVISSKDAAQLAQETHTTTTGNAKAVNQTLAYEGSGKEAAYDKSELEAGDLSASTGSEIYSESTGSEAKHHSTLQGSTTTSERVQQITDTNAASEQKDSSGEYTATHKQEATASQVSITESVTDGSAVVTEKKVIDANALVTALIEQGVTIENVEAFDRLIVDATGSSRQIQVDEFKVGDTFEVDTQNDVVQVKGQLKISNGDDYRGPVGNSQYYEYAYATQEGKDTNDWYIDNPDDPYDIPEGTVWRKHRMVTIIDGETTTGKWSEPYLLTGKDGAEGDTLYWVYMYSADGVLEDPSAEVPSGWSSELKDGHLYRIERLKNKGVYEGVWSTPAKIAGADGDNGELVFEEYMYSPYGTSTPDNDTQGHWHTNFTSGDFYRSSRLIKYAAGTPIPLPADAEPIEVTAWTTPALITPRKGYEYSDGLSQIVVHMYIRSQSAPALPTATLTYDFNTFTLSGDKAGWATEIPEGTGNLWLTIATASSNTGSDDIAPNEWTSPQLSATQAYNQASLSLYKRSPVGVVPDAPSTTLTYDFTTGVLTGDLEGWSNGTIPAGTDDLYIASAAVRSQTNTADVEPEYWGVGILTSTAFRQQTVNIYKRGNATPPSADVTYNFTDGSVTGLTEGWTLGIPSGSEDVFIGVAVASAAGATDIINPADWSIGPLGTSGHQAVVLNLYMSSQTKPQEPQVEITYDFTQGKIVSDTGLWSTSVPQNTEGKIYVTTATANASALSQTDVIPVGEWTDPQVILESGINAVLVTLYRKHALDITPDKHTNDLTYSFDNAGLVNQPDNNWKSTPMSVELGEAVWSMTATAQGLATDSTDIIAPTEFSDPVIYTATGSEVFTAYRYAEAETGPWYDEFTPARVWRIQGTSVNGVINDWSDPVKMTGEDGAVGDTIYFEYNYSEDLSDWHPVLVEGDIWRRERTVNNGVAGEWSSPARLKGNEQYIEYQYSASLGLGEDGWHSNFSSGDYYRRERSIINGVAGAWTQGVQIVPLKDVDYSDGVGGDTIYEVYQYSVDGLTDWEYDFEDHHIYRRTAVVINGALGAWSEPAKLSGIDGAPGDTIYMEYEYSADGTSWHKEMQDGDIWRHEREHTVGVTEPTDPWGNRTRIRGVDGAYYEYLYNEDNDNYPTTPSDDLGTWHTNFSEGDYYRIERLVQESSVGDWTTPTKLKPKKGEDYNDGIQGPKGEDGTTMYTWLKYADDASGSNMSDNPVGKAYMGLAYNKTTDEESTNPNDYAWSKVEGDQGVAGENGYMWVQYSNYDDGLNGSVPAMSQNPIDESTGRPYMYIGISYNNPDPTEGSDPTAYTWSKYIGDEIYYEYSYSPDKISWDMTIDENDVWRRERRVENGQYGEWSDAIRIVGTEGPQGIQGETGADGESLYTWVRYADDSDGNGISNNPTNKKYIGFAYNKTTPVESNNKGDYVWALVQGADGKDGLNGADGVDGLDGEQGIAGQDGKDGVSSYFHTAYADGPNGEGFSQSPTGKDYIGTYSSQYIEDSTNPAAYTWMLVKGAQGEDGAQGIPGVDGETGKTSYLHIAYAETAQGGYMSQDPEGKDYIGQYVDFTLEDSTDPSDYTWSKIKGEQGNQGVEGPAGADGKPTYTWIKYSPNADGSNLTDTPQDDTKYLGISPNQTDINESSNPADYTWSAYTGSDGQYYEDEFSITGDPLDEEAWHYPAFHQDKFKRTRLIDSEGEPVVDPTTDANGWVYTQIAPIKDVDYGDGNSGDTIYEVYQYSVNGVDNWEDDFKDEHVFRRTAVVINGSQSDWSAAARIMGNDGANGLQSNVITLYQVKQQRYTWLPAELIQTEETYNIISGSFVDYDTESGINGWMLDVPAVLNEGEALYQVRVAALSEAGQLEVDIPADDWAAPVQITASGVSGSDGKHGSGSYIVNWEDTYNGGNGYASLITAIETPLTEGHVEYWFQEISTRESQAGDMLTIQQPEVDSAIPVQWIRSDAAWEKFTLTVDGSAVVNGTLAAQALKSETAITDILYVASNASRAELTLSGSGGWTDGSGDTVGSSDYRIWLGAINPDDAPYSVDKNGKLKTQGAEVSGHITAETMTFVESNNELDELGMVQLSGGGYKSDPTKGWAIDSAGSATFMNMYARGTIESSTFRSGTIIGSTIYSVDTEELADPYWGTADEGTVTYYSYDVNVPVAVHSEVSTLTDATPNNDSSELAAIYFTEFEFYAAADNDSEFSQDRAKYPDLPAGVLVGTYSYPVIRWGNTYGASLAYASELHSGGNGTLRLSFTESLSGNVEYVDVVFNPLVDTTRTITLKGIDFTVVIDTYYQPQKVRTQQGGHDDRDYLDKGYYGLYITLTSKAGDFGDVTNKSLNGKFKWGMNIPNHTIYDFEDEYEQTINHTAYKMYARATITNTER